MFSRTTTLIRSRNRWARAKMAEARRVTSTAPRITTRVMPMSSSPMTWSMEKAMSTPMTHMRGTGSTICTLQTKACWTTFTSLRVRVIMEPVPNPLKITGGEGQGLVVQGVAHVPPDPGGEPGAQEAPH